MNLTERIEKIGEYFDSMSVAATNGIIYVRVHFPKGWGCSEVTKHNFNVSAVNDEIPGYVYFFSKMEEGFDRIFDAIDYNISFNKEAEVKVSLLKEKIEELKTIFENEDVDTLKTLEFKYKRKKLKVKKEKEEPLKEEVLQNNIIEIKESLNEENIIMEE